MVYLHMSNFESWKLSEQNHGYYTSIDRDARQVLENLLIFCIGRNLERVSKVFSITDDSNKLLYHFAGLKKNRTIPNGFFFISLQKNKIVVWYKSEKMN